MTFTDFALFILFIIIPIFRLFNSNLLQHLHDIIAISSILIVLAGIIRNRLDEYLSKLIRYLIPVLLSTIAIHFFLQTYDSAQIKITLLEVGGPIVFILWLIKRINIGNLDIADSRRAIVIPSILFLLSGILSFTLSPFHLETFEPGLIRRVSYLGVFIVTIFEFNRKEDFKRIISWLMATCFIVVAYGYIQKMGLDWHIWKGAFGTSIFSTFGNPNFFSAWLVLMLPLIMTKVFLAKSWQTKSIVLLFAVLTIYAIVETGTKGSWVGMGVEAIVFIILSTLFFVKGNPKVIKKVTLVLVFLIVLATTTGVIMFSLKRISSIRFRLFTWGAAMKMITEPIYSNPVKTFFLGQGIETFKLVYPSYRRPEIFHIEGKHNTETDHAHNEFLEIFYDEGIVGLTILLWLLISIFYMAVKRLNNLGIGKAHEKEEFYIVGLFSGTLGMLAHASVSVHVRFVSSGYILWTLLGLLVVITSPIQKKEYFKSDKLSNEKLMLILMLLVAIGFNSFHASRRFLANIYHNRAIAYSKQRIWKPALEFYKKVQKYHPSFIMAYYFEGNVYNDKLTEALKAKNSSAIQENYKKALETYDKVLSMYPNYVQVHFQEGMLHLKVGRMDKAKESFRKYLNIVDPVYQYTYYRLGMIAANQGNIDLAQNYMQEAPKRIMPHMTDMRLEAYLNLANIYMIRKNYPKAEAALKQALELKNKHEQTLRMLTSVYENWGKKDQAINVLEKLLELHPDNDSIKQKIGSLKT